MQGKAIAASRLARAPQIMHLMTTDVSVDVAIAASRSLFRGLNGDGLLFTFTSYLSGVSKVIGDKTEGGLTSERF